MEGTEGSRELNVPSIAGAGEVEAGEYEGFGEDYGGGRIGLSGGGHGNSDLDEDFLCPICIQIMKEAFLTKCGHSFCYTCIMTHLNIKNNCPCCGQYLTNSHLFPNVLLNKLLRKASASQFLATASPMESIRFALTKGEVSVKELDSLLRFLAFKKRKAEQEEAESNMEILSEFLEQSRQSKQKALDELQADLQFVKEDIMYVEKQKLELLRSKEQFARKIRMLFEGHAAQLDRLGSDNFSAVGPVSPLRSNQGGADVPSRHASQRRREGQLRNVLGVPFKRELSCDSTTSESQCPPANAAILVSKRRKLLSQFEDLQECYFQTRRSKAAMTSVKAHKDGNLDTDFPAEDRSAGLDDFHSVLSAITRYSKLQVIAELRHGDLFHSSNVVSSIEFDRDDEYFATAGNSRRITVFQYATVVNELADVHYPVAEMSTRTKLSCLSWNKYIKSHVASSDYEGIVMVWDANTRQSIIEYEEHETRAWSLDFSRNEPTRLVSGSDDGKVKVWCTRQENSVINIDMNANVCSVKYNPSSSNFVALGSADHDVHYYDLRHVQQPLYVFSGHQRTVSYVKFVSPTELASASTDGTLRLWDVQKNIPIRTLKGHTNEKNFVGLAANNEYLTCGSETNEVFVYHKAMSKPTALHHFGSSDHGENEDDSSVFISAVCWKSESPTLLAANSQGTVKVLVLAP